MTDTTSRRRVLLSSAAIDLLERLAQHKAHPADPGWDASAWRELRAQGLAEQPESTYRSPMAGLSYGQRQAMKRRGFMPPPPPRIWPRLTRGGRMRLHAIQQGRARAAERRGA